MEPLVKHAWAVTVTAAGSILIFADAWRKAFIRRSCNNLRFDFTHARLDVEKLLDENFSFVWSLGKFFAVVDVEKRLVNHFDAGEAPVAGLVEVDSAFVAVVNLIA